MPIPSSSFVLFLCLLLLRRSTAFPVRRILHQPFFPLDSLPPAPSPSTLPPPSPPAKLPFSSTTTPTPTTTTNPSSPFFPTYPSPPPPPTPSTFASFPANISSLILPQSPSSKTSSKSNHKLLVLSLSFLFAAVVVSAVLAVYFCRRRRSENNPPPSVDSKTHASSDQQSSMRFYSVNPDRGSGSRHKLRPANTSSEFLYLGTLVNSHGIGNGGGSNPAAIESSPVVGKMDSPELRPLPPLNQHRGQNQDSFGSPEDEDEEFYSPRGSLGSGGRDSSGSGSRRMFRAMGAGSGSDFEEGGTTDSTTCSSDSSSGSPARSHSVSISPPMSLSPRNNGKSSPESARVVYPGPAPACPPMPPRGNETELLSSASPSPSLSASSTPRISFDIEQMKRISPRNAC